VISRGGGDDGVSIYGGEDSAWPLACRSVHVKTDGQQIDIGLQSQPTSVILRVSTQLGTSGDFRDSAFV
jgi:hypothetical protein